MSDFMYTPQEQEKINNAVEEAVDSLIRVSAEKDLRKDIVENLKEELGMKPAMFNALVNERYEGKSSKSIEKHQDTVELNDLLKNNCNKSVS